MFDYISSNSSKEIIQKKNPRKSRECSNVGDKNLKGLNDNPNQRVTAVRWNNFKNYYPKNSATIMT